jgi:hypothetical protein
MSKVKLGKSDYFFAIPVLIILLLFTFAKFAVAVSVQKADVCINSIYTPSDRNPNIESVELYVTESGNLQHYVLTDGTDKVRIELPPVQVNKGHYVRVFTGDGEENAKKIYMKINEAVWEKAGVIQLYYKDIFVEEFEY